MPAESVIANIGKLYQEDSEFIDELDENIQECQQLCQQFTDLDDEKKQKMSYAQIKKKIKELEQGIKTIKALQALLLAKLNCIEESSNQPDEEIVDQINDKLEELSQTLEQFEYAKYQLDELGVAALKKKYKKRYKKIKSQLSIQLCYSLFLWGLSGVFIAYFALIGQEFLQNFDRCKEVYGNIQIKNQAEQIYLLSFTPGNEIYQCINIKLILENSYRKLLPIIIGLFEIIYFIVISMNKNYKKLKKTWQLHHNVIKRSQKAKRNQFQSLRALIHRN